MSDRQAAHGADEGPPPILGSWRNVYFALLGELAALVALFAILTVWAS